jgi:hypothetical protein
MDDDIASALHRHDVQQVTPPDLERIRRVVGRRRKARAAATIGGGLLVAAGMVGVLAVAAPSVQAPEGDPVPGAPGQPTAVGTARVRPSPMVTVPSQGEDAMRQLQTVMASHEARDVDYDVLDVTEADDTGLLPHTEKNDRDVRVLRGMYQARGTAKPLPTGNSAIMFTVETNVCEPGRLVRAVERRGDHIVIRLREPAEGSDCVVESRDGYLITLAIPSQQLKGTGGALVAPDGQ